MQVRPLGDDQKFWLPETCFREAGIFASPECRHLTSSTAYIIASTLIIFLGLVRLRHSSSIYLRCSENNPPRIKSPSIFATMLFLGWELCMATNCCIFKHFVIPKHTSMHRIVLRAQLCIPCLVIGYSVMFLMVR